MSDRNTLSGEEKSLKQRIRAGEIILGVGVSLDTSRSQLEAILSQDNYDYLYIDGQHTAFTEDKLVAFCAMAEELDMPVHFRITHTRHAYLIGRYLDLGPTGIIVPEVQDEATAEEASQAFYYPQAGQRSWGKNSRGAGEQGSKGEFSFSPLHPRTPAPLHSAPPLPLPYR